MIATRRNALALAFAPIGLLVAASCVGSSRSVVTVRGDGSDIAVVADGQLVTQFRFAEQRVPTLYPLHAADGTPVTRGFPLEERPDEQPDHPHHVSVWLAHGDVNGIDFWHDPDATIEVGDAVLSEAGAGEARIRSRHLWVHANELVLIEDRTMKFGFDGDTRWIDFAFELSPGGESVTFGDTKEGTFAVRTHPELRLRGPVAKGSAHNSEGVFGPEVWGKRARWVAYSGPVEGKPVVLAMMDHPDNPRHPTWWHARDYGLCAANPFGIHDFEDAPPAAGALRVASGEVLRLDYRVVVQVGEFDADLVEELWEDFAD